jgi:precorrin-2 dehydrogenase / sirohydrochlorin ferrochelatase
MCDKVECRYYPILVDLRGRKVLVVGGGRVAHRKIITLLQHGASVEVAARDLDPPLADLAEQGLIGYRGREFSEDHLDGVFLVIAATSDAMLNHRVSEAAHSRGLLVNAVDQPSDCNFIVPSILRRGDLIVSVSTSGKSPAFARKIREDLEEHFGDEFESFLAIMGRLRERVLSLGLPQEQNKEIFEKLVASGLLSCLREKDWEAAASIVTEILGRPFASEEIMPYMRSRK